MLEAVERAIGFAKEEGEEGDRGEDIAEDFSDVNADVEDGSSASTTDCRAVPNSATEGNGR